MLWAATLWVIIKFALSTVFTLTTPLRRPPPEVRQMIACPVRVSVFKVLKCICYVNAAFVWVCDIVCKGDKKFASLMSTSLCMLLLIPFNSLAIGLRSDFAFISMWDRDGLISCGPCYLIYIRKLQSGKMTVHLMFLPKQSHTSAFTHKQDKQITKQPFLKCHC